MSYGKKLMYVRNVNISVLQEDKAIEGIFAHHG